jgi:hypothetical protein
MQKTGMVPRRPAAAWEIASSAWMAGNGGAAPTSCGLSDNAARNNAPSNGAAPIGPALAPASAALWSLVA